MCVDFGRRSPGVPREVNQIGHLFFPVLVWGWGEADGNKLLKEQFDAGEAAAVDQGR